MFPLAGLPGLGRPLDTDLLADLVVAHLEDVGQAHLARGAHRERDKPFLGHHERDDAVVDLSSVANRSFGWNSTLVNTENISP